MASFSAGTTFTDGVANDVTAAKLGALVNNATPTSGLIQDRTAETVVGSNDTFLIGDASDSNNLKRITVANVMKAELTGSVNSTAGTIETATLGTTTGTAATFTNGTITTGVIPNLTAGTTTGTAATITSLTAGTTTSTAAVITSITSGTGTASAPAISPTGDSNTGIFFPAADTTAFSEGGVEAMRIDSTGRLILGNGDTSATPTSGTLRVTNSSGSNVAGGNLTFEAGSSTGNASGGFMAFRTTGTGINGTDLNSSTERLRISSSGNIGIGTTSPVYKLDVGGNGIRVNNAFAQILLTDTTGGTTTGGFVRYVSNGSSGSYTYQINTAAAGDFTTANNVYTISSAGNVGIGTFSPSAIFHVRQDNNGITRSILQNRNASGTPIVELDFITSTFDLSDNRYAYIQSGGANNQYLAFGNGQGDAPTEKMRIASTGNVGIGTTSPVNRLEIVGSFGRGAPVTKTGDFTLADTENWLIVNKGSTCTVTLPAASSWTGREFTIRVITPHAVVSASSNVVPRAGGAAGTAILPATDGAWATLVSDGTNWQIMCSS